MAERLTIEISAMTNHERDALYEATKAAIQNACPEAASMPTLGKDLRSYVITVTVPCVTDAMAVKLSVESDLPTSRVTVTEHITIP